ncbi:galactosylceramide sulfotransferase isoform X2 [Hippocampus zosterae]|uniref:galactosylceramide sulfotransferase isoform X2 n=1 Tax=Hippocampus zosterae TaxID=109293 RepID=UPI00223DAEE9|nr:galactosylceramide sulfotransferase isoform X2 [Hippocampus zosterae]
MQVFLLDFKMLHVAGNKRTTVTRGFVLWLLLTNIMILVYRLTLPMQVDIRDATCTLNMGKPFNENLPRPSRRLQTDTCAPSGNIMFLKTHKTASSTLLNILFRFGEKHKLKFAFPNGRNDFFYPSPFRRWQVKSYQPGQCFNVVCNHMRFHPAEVGALLPPDATYVTILRHPACVLESAFHYYHRAVPFTWKIGGRDKLEEFLRSPRTYYSAHAYNAFYLKNLLLFDLGSDNNLDADHPDVTEAIQSLSQRFHLVLIAEYFDESLILLKETLCWSMEDILYFKLNARMSASVSRLTPESRARALGWNGADWRLYRHFNATLWDKVEEYGRERMKRDVAELRRRNAEMRALCLEGGEAVEALRIRDRRFLPWQPLGVKSILGYNVRKDIHPEFRSTCEKMLTPEIQYLADLGVSLWLTRLWGWLKDAIS